MRTRIISYRGMTRTSPCGSARCVLQFPAADIRRLIGTNAAGLLDLDTK
jgi:hypothetical protein